jgi:hypothetical protein
MLGHIDQVAAAVADIDGRIAELLQPMNAQCALLAGVPGINSVSSAGVLAEIGPDMSKAVLVVPLHLRGGLLAISTAALAQSGAIRNLRTLFSERVANSPSPAQSALSAAAPLSEPPAVLAPSATPPNPPAVRMAVPHRPSAAGSDTGASVSQASPPESSTRDGGEKVQRTTLDEDAYASAHRLHFGGGDPAAALLAWEDYLRRFPDGRFAPEANYNRAIDLLKLRRYAEARAALTPFATGAYGDYRRDDALALLRSIP